MTDMELSCDQCQTFVNEISFPCAQCGAMSFGELLPITNTEMDDAPWNSPEFEEGQRKQRRAEWIRENVAMIFGAYESPSLGGAIRATEQMADELEKRGYL